MENPGGHLSRPFLGPWDNFSKSYDENQIWSERTDVPEVFLFNRDHQQVCMADLVFVRTFSKNYCQDLKIVQKDAPRDSLQSVLKIRS